MSLMHIDIAGIAAITQRMTADLHGVRKSCATASERAAKRTLGQIRTEALRIVRENYTASTKDMREQSKIVVRPGATEAFLKLSGPRGLPLSFFAPRPARKPDWRGVAPRSRKPKAGVSSMVRRGGSRFVAASGGYKPFWAAAGGKDFLFRRTGKKNMRMVRDPRTGKMRPRQVEEKEFLYGPSPLHVLDSVGARDRLARLATDVYQRRLRHELDRLLLAGVKTR